MSNFSFLKEKWPIFKNLGRLVENKFIIYRSAQLSRMDRRFLLGVAYNLLPYAREFLNKNLKKGSIKIKNDIVEYKLA